MREPKILTESEVSRLRPAWRESPSIVAVLDSHEALRAQLKAAKGETQEALNALACETLESKNLRAQLAAAQQREKEAVERAEAARTETEGVRDMWFTALNMILTNPTEIDLIGRYDTDRVRAALRPFAAMKARISELEQAAEAREREIPEWLISSAQALLDLDTKGALVPHGLGGHAYRIIQEFLDMHAPAATPAPPTCSPER